MASWLVIAFFASTLLASIPDSREEEVALLYLNWASPLFFGDRGRSIAESCNSKLQPSEAGVHLSPGAAGQQPHEDDVIEDAPGKKKSPGPGMPS